MNEQEQRRHDDLLRMMETDGWKHFVEAIQNDVIVLNNLMSVSTEKELHYRHGKIDALAGIINYQEHLKTVDTAEVPDYEDGA